MAVGHADASLAEDPAAAALRAELGEIGVAAIDREAKFHRQRPLAGRDGEAAEMRRRRIGDQRADALEQARPGQQLFGQRSCGAVVAADQVQAPPGMGVRQARQEAEIVADRRFGHRLAGDEHDRGAGQAQEEEHAQHALLVVVRARDPCEHVGVEAEAGQDEDRPRCRGVGLQARVGTREAGLQLLEAGPLGVACHRHGVRRTMRRHAASTLAVTLLAPAGRRPRVRSRWP